MPELLQVALFVSGVMGALFLLGVLIYYPRNRRWTLKAEAEGVATCRDCGYVGTLSYGLLAGARVSSANIRTVCAKCGSRDWYIPGGKRDGKDTRSRAEAEKKNVTPK